MPKFNRRGNHYTAGFAGEQGSLDGAYYPFRTFGGGVFLDDDLILLQLAGPSSVALATYRAGGDPAIIEPPRTANSFSAGGNRWVAWANGVGLFGAVEDPVAGIPDNAMGPDGTVGYVPNYLVGSGLILQGPDGVRQAAIPGIVPYDLQILGPRTAIWRGGAIGRPATRPAFADAAGTKLVTFQGKDYLVYWSNARSALVLQEDGSMKGWILDTRPNAFNHDVVATEDAIRMIWSITSGERPQDLVICEFTGGIPFYTRTATGFSPMPPKFEDLKLPPIDPPIIDPPKPDPLAVTITSYEPDHGEAPLIVTAVAKVTSGKADTLIWRWRKIGAAAWQIAATNPVADLDHHYKFDTEGDYEISLQGKGPAGVAETGLQRRVTVTRKEDPVDPVDPVEPADFVPTRIKTWSGHCLVAEDGGGDEGQTIGGRPAGLVTARGKDSDGPPWQYFEVRKGRQPGTIGFRSSGDRWFTAELDTTLVCNRKIAEPYQPEAWQEFTLVDAGDGWTALKSNHGLFVRAEGGGGSTVKADATSVGVWESFKFDPPLSASVPGGNLDARQGIVRAAGHCLVDDGGPFLAIGITLFPIGWMFKFDLARLKANLAKLKGRVHYVRGLAVVGGSGWEDRACDPRWSDWQQVIAGATDLAYDEFGIRVQWTVFGGLDPSCPKREDRDRVVQQIGAVIAARPHKVISIEVMNEAWQNGFGDKRDEAKQHCRTLRQLTPCLVSVTAPAGQPSDEEMTQEVRSWYDGANATATPAHLSRDQNGTGGTSRPVRQPWEVQFWGGNPPAIWDDQEPIGPRSSGAMDDDPERLAMSRAVAWTCGMAKSLLHCGAGVRMGGAADQGTGKFYLPREANIYDVPGIDTILDGINALHALMPADAPNGARQNGNSKFPDHPFDYHELTEDKVLRVYATNLGDRFVACCIQVLAPLQLKAKRPMHVKVYRAAQPWDLVVERDLGPGEAVTVEGVRPDGKHYLVIGNYR